jgi:hypothetical protein
VAQEQDSEKKSLTRAPISPIEAPNITEKVVAIAMLIEAKLIPNLNSKAHFHLMSVWVFVSNFSQNWIIRNKVAYFTNIYVNTPLCDCSYSVNNSGCIFKTLAAELLFNICIVCDRGLLFQTIQ